MECNYLHLERNGRDYAFGQLLPLQGGERHLSCLAFFARVRPGFWGLAKNRGAFYQIAHSSSRGEIAMQ